jgi:hypothetical protein
LTKKGATMKETTADQGPVERGVGQPVPERTNADAPICPWCDRQGWDTCGSDYDTYTCEAAG